MGDLEGRGCALLDTISANFLAPEPAAGCLAGWQAVQVVGRPAAACGNLVLCLVVYHGKMSSQFHLKLFLIKSNDATRDLNEWYIL